MDIRGLLLISIVGLIGAAPSDAARLQKHENRGKGGGKKGCLSSEIESIAYGPSATKRLKAKRERIPADELEADANWDALDDEAHEERQLQEMYGRPFNEVIRAAEQGEFQGVPLEQLRNEWRLVRAIEKIDSLSDRGKIANGLDELRHLLTHTFQMEGRLEYLGDSGTRVSLLWRHPDGRTQVLKFPRYQRLFAARFRAELAEKRMLEITLREGIPPARALVRAKQETRNAAVPPLSSQSYSEFVATTQYFDALQAREDKLMKVLKKWGLAASPGKAPSGTLAPLAELRAKLSDFVEGPDLEEVISAYRIKMGNGDLHPEDLPPLLKTALLFESGVAGRSTPGGLGGYYSGMRQELLKELGTVTFESTEVGPFILHGKRERSDVIVDLNAGRNTKVDSRLWARDSQGGYLTRERCTGALLLWVVSGGKSTCVNLGLAQMPNFIDG